MPLNVAVFGSCVSRDPIGLLPDALTPVHYTARQSWVSADSPGLWAPPIDRLSSPFQRRMLRDDFHSSLLTRIGEHAPDADLVVLDIIDDRLGVIELLPGRFATLSAELSASGWLAGDRYLRRRRLHLGEAEHLRRFVHAAQRVKTALIDAGAWHKTLMVRAPYATTTVEGDALMGDRGMTPEEWDQRYTGYYRALVELGFTMIEPSADRLFSSREHRWGAHPIHYQRTASLQLAEQMLDFHSQSAS